MDIDDIARQNLEASNRELERENDEDEIEPSEEDIALDSLSREAYADYRAIRNAIAFSDLAERFVDMAVNEGLRNRHD